MTASLTMIGRSIRLSRRNFDLVIMAIVLPVLMMALFVYVFGGAISSTQSYVDYVVPGILVLCTGYGATSTAMSVTDDMKKGVVDRFRSMPISGFSVLTGHVVASVARNALATFAVVLVALLMGFRPAASLAGWVLAMGLLLLYVLALSWLAAGFGVVARSVESASLLGFFMLFIPYLSSAFVPVETMPSFLRAVSEHQPITPVIETVRALLNDQPVTSGWLALVWSGGLLVAAFGWATWLFGRINRR
ncbi:ABC-2 type transport system permease protein [Lentzea albidocapillata subsp. violacea]|uniref:Transport permease protein n=1 Tax=Lentzea albidocapillata subsp. violacea TaxID=128104 RepID=A0A1G8ZEQ2_9PSEU|nr:ABC transporter permease [Lentzea albidocapillata]SDK13606.1 ABC-2 type transport system permease protein [Lentzea albidocapillata subsp. violacea]